MKTLLPIRVPRYTPSRYALRTEQPRTRSLFFDRLTHKKVTRVEQVSVEVLVVFGTTYS